jgi:hypothetical protein
MRCFYQKLPEEVEPKFLLLFSLSEISSKVKKWFRTAKEYSLAQ